MQKVIENKFIRLFSFKRYSKTFFISCFLILFFIFDLSKAESNNSNFEIINQPTEYDVRCSVKGGGPTGQAGAMVHGISKALVMFDDNFKSTLKTEKLTTRDSRAVERKKPGRKKARRSFQFSKR